MSQANGLRAEHTPLKIKAQSHDDLKIISGLLQDALLPVTGLKYFPKAKQFQILANRFRHELEPDDHEGDLVYYRTHSGICFDHVHKIRHKGFDHKDPTHFLNLLAVNSNEDTNEIDLICSDHATIRLHTEKVLCHLGDLHEHWPTKVKPQHAFLDE